MRPEWLKIRLPHGKNFTEVKSILKEKQLHTVCEEALCPNIGECFEQKTATFLILGNTCTRQCGFCAVDKGIPKIVDEEEPHRIAEAAKSMKLKYVVVTSVTRDDLPDGGASIYARTIHSLRECIKGCRIEVLVPDFKGDLKALTTVLESYPDILNHNIETVPRLYPQVRPAADYIRSLELLRKAHVVQPSVTTKSGLMLGLGETWDEIIDTIKAIKTAGCDILTLGQYLSPRRNALPIHRYYTPAEFEKLKKEGLKLGFKHIESGPLVRSSYHAMIQSDMAHHGYSRNSTEQ